MVSRNSTIRRFRLIVEFGKNLVKYELHGFPKSFSDFSSCFVDLVEDVHDDLEACFRGCLGHVILGLLDAFQDDSLAGTRHMRKQAVFDGIVLGTVGRVVSHANRDSHAVHQRLQVFFEQVLRSAVAAAAVALQQKFPRPRIRLATLGSPPLKDAVAGKRAGVVTGAEIEVSSIPLEVVNAVRNHGAFGKGEKVMVKDLAAFGGEEPSLAIKQAEHLLFLGVDADDRVGRIQERLLVRIENVELLMPVLVLTHGQIFEGLAMAELTVVQELFDEISTGRKSRSRHETGDGLHGQVRPQAIGFHGVARRVLLQHGLEGRHEFWRTNDQVLSSAPFFRHRSGGSGGRSLRSAWPWRMVLGSQPSKDERYSIPPWPSFSASTAAYRRWSFSRSDE